MIKTNVSDILSSVLSRFFGNWKCYSTDSTIVPKKPLIKNNPFRSFSKSTAQGM